MRRGGARGSAVWALAAAAALPAVVAAVTAVGVDWAPASDYAPLEVRVRDVFSAHPPLVGPFSRLGANHPGPMLFYLLAGPYRLVGSQPWALLVTAALVNAASVGLAVRIAGRRGRVDLAAGVAALAVACGWVLGADHLRDPWNPRIAVFPFLLAALAAWAVACGSRRSLPVAAVALSFCVQAHVGYALLAAVLGGWCLLGLWWHRSAWRARPRPAVVAVALVGLLWAVPVAQQVGGDVGNLTAIVSEARHDPAPRWGLTGIDRYLLPHLGPTPAWFRSSASDPFELGGRKGLAWPPLGAVALAVGAGVALRRRDREPLLLVGVTASAWLAGAVSIALVKGAPAPYLYRWVWALGILLWAAAAWPLLRAGVAVAAVRRGGARWAGPGPSVAAVAAVGLLAVVAVVAEWGPAFGPYRNDYRQAAVVADRAVATARQRLGPGGRVEVRGAGGVVFIVPAVVAGLERAGFATRVEAGGGAVWGHHRIPGRGPVDLVVVVSDADAAEARVQRPGLDLVATVDMLSVNERRELVSLPSAERCRDVGLEAWLGRGSGPSEAERAACRRRHALVGRDRHVSVWVEPGGH